nr:glucokinase [Luteimonas salinisoli]
MIAADVGGTHARVGHVRIAADGTQSVLGYRQYDCADHPTLAAVLRAFMAQAGVGHAADAAVAIAGVLDGDMLVNSNLPWPVSLAQTRHDAGLRTLTLLNDFEAVAFAVPHVDSSQASLVCGDPAVPEEAPVLVLGPGTGLGAALYLPGMPPRVLPSEAGHAALAVGSERELEVLRHLLGRWPHVDADRVLSGPGLVNTYGALCALDRVDPRLSTPSAISRAALDGRDRQAIEALSIFCALLGSFAGDLALAFGARQVHLAGGIPARIAPFLRESDFAMRFRNKGVLAGQLARTPVWLVEHGLLGVLGAALAWAAGREANPQP